MEVDTKLTGNKCELLIKELENNNIILTEPLVYKFPNSWDKDRPEKPWESHEQSASSLYSKMRAVYKVQSEEQSVCHTDMCCLVETE